MNLEFVKQLKADYPQYLFLEGDNFQWSPQKNTIFYTSDNYFEILILHELAHAICNHKNFNQDIELIKMEAEAWSETSNLAKKYNINLSNDLEQNNLDSYREWIHQRSLCPNCKINGFQRSESIYSCPACGKNWQVNDSRFKQLRRKAIK